MSRIGKQPIDVPSGVKVQIVDRQVTVETGKARLSMTHRPEVSVELDEQAKQIVVTRLNDERKSKAFHGMTRSLIANMVQGVSQGYAEELEIVGVGWNAQLKGQQIALNVGYADPKVVKIPDGVTVEVNGPRIKVSGPDKQKVGNTASAIRSKRKPEPYNGKGIKYIDEVITRKEGKQFAGG